MGDPLDREPWDDEFDLRDRRGCVHVALGLLGLVLLAATFVYLLVKDMR